MSKNPNREDKFIWSCYLYYWLGTPVLSDWEFDELVEELEKDWDNLSNNLKSRLEKNSIKTTAHTLRYTDEEIKAAEGWLKNNAS